MVTKKDIQIIKDCILKSGIKDSEFEQYEANLTGEEYVALVIDDKNYKIKVKDFLNTSSTIIELKGLSPISSVINLGDWPEYGEPQEGDYVFAQNALYKCVNGGWQEQILQAGEVYAVYKNSLYKINYKNGVYTVTRLLMGGGDYDLSDFATKDDIEEKVETLLSERPINSDAVNNIMTLLNGLNVKVIQLKAAEVTPDTTYSEAILPIPDIIWDNGQQGDYVWTMNEGLQGFNPTTESWETNYGLIDPNKTFVVWNNIVYKLEENGATKLMDLGKITDNLPKSKIIKFVDNNNISNSTSAFANSVEGQYTYYGNVLFHKENGQQVVVTDLDWDNTLLYNKKGLYKYNPNGTLIPIYEPSSTSLVNNIKSDIERLNTLSSFILNVAYCGIDTNLPNPQTYKEGDLIILINSQAYAIELYKKVGNSFESYNLFNGVELDIDDPRLFIAYKGNLWKINKDTCEIECVLQGGKYEQFTLNHIIPKELGTVTWDTFVDNTCKVIAGITVEEYSDLLSYTQNYNRPKYILCFEDDILYEFYDGDESYHNYTEYIRTCPGDVYFINSGINEIYKLDKPTEVFNRVLTAEVISKLSSTSKLPVQSKILFEKFSEKANKNNAQLTGKPVATQPDLNSDDNQIATTSFVRAIIANAILNASMPESEVDLSDLLNQVQDLTNKKVEIINITAIVDDLNEIVNPEDGQNFILLESGENPFLYRAAPLIGGSEDEQIRLVNGQSTFILYENALQRWDSNISAFVPILDLNIVDTVANNNYHAVTSNAVYNALQSKASVSALDAKAPIDSPVFTGTPKLSATPSTSDNSTKIATTAFVKSVVQALNIPSVAPAYGTEIYAVDGIYTSEQDVVAAGDATAIQVDSSDVVLWTKDVENPTSINDYTSEILNQDNLFVVCNKILYKFDVNQRDFVGILDANYQVAQTIIPGGQLPVRSSAIYSALESKADKANPTFTGIPKAPTATAGTNTQQIATTAFVKTAVDNAISSLDLSNAQVNTDINNSDIPDVAYQYNINNHAWANSSYDDRPVTLGDIKKLMDLGFVDALANYMVALDAKIASLS